MLMIKLETNFVEFMEVGSSSLYDTQLSHLYSMSNLDSLG